MADNNLKNLLDELDDDIANKDNKNKKLVVSENNNKFSKDGYIGEHKKQILSVIAGLVLLIGAYQLTTIATQRVDNKPTNSRTVSNNVNNENVKQKELTNIKNDIENKSMKKSESKRSYSGEITDINKAGEFLVSYFRNIDNKHFQASWRQLSPNWRTHFTSIDTYSAMYKDTLSQNIEIVNVEYVNSNKAVVYFKLVAIDRTNSGTKKQFFAGKWDVIKQDGRLYMDNPDVKKL